MSKAFALGQLRKHGRASVVATVKHHCCNGVQLGKLARYFHDTNDGPGMLYLENLGVVVGQVDREGWDQLRASAALDDVSGAVPLQPVTGTGSAADVAAAPELSWGLEKIGVPELWAKGLTGRGVLVAHLDTGVDGTHPSLAGAMREFAEFDALGQAISGAAVADSALHGTHTAGIIAGRPGGPFTIGVAPGCKLVSGAVIEGGDPVKRILAGLNWALGFPVKVLNLSAGFEGHFQQYAPLVKKVRARGVLPVFAAGNSGAGTSYAPANYRDAMAVGSVDADGNVDPDSSSEKLKQRTDARVPDLAMPGVDVISANAGGGYRADSGTSMAAPHAAGLAALLWEAFPLATVDQVEKAIYASCSLAGSMTTDRAGRGLPNGVRALAALEAAMTKKGRAAVTS